MPPAHSNFGPLYSAYSSPSIRRSRSFVETSETNRERSARSAKALWRALLRGLFARCGKGNGGSVRRARNRKKRTLSHAKRARHHDHELSQWHGRSGERMQEICFG